MLCGYLRPTSGTAKIFHYDLLEDVEEIHAQLGVCPQDNVLWDDLTGPEHLAFYGRIKGLRGSELNRQILYWLTQVNLHNDLKKTSSQYSGGMKRRLCVAMALIGDPGVVLLDEPTTGLDPSSKRQLWNVLKKMKSSCALLLTTHSMEEAESLCDRLGIFIGGKLATVGAPSDLKSKFGKGYKLTITTTQEKIPDIQRFVEENIKKPTLFSQPIAGTISYSIPKKYVTLGQLFNLVEKNKKKLGILDWGISNTTLEEVFLHIVDKEFYEQEKKKNTKDL